MRRTSRTGERSSGGSAGYTLLELLVVLTIIAAIVSLATPMLSRLGAQRLDAQAESVGDAFRQARARAIRDNAEVLVAVDTAAGVVREAEGRELATLAPGVELGIVAAASERVDAATGGIRFLPDGSSSGGRVTLARDGRSVAVEVDWFDGSVRVRPASKL